MAHTSTATVKGSRSLPPAGGQAVVDHASRGLERAPCPTPGEHRCVVGARQAVAAEQDPVVGRPVPAEAEVGLPGRRRRSNGSSPPDSQAVSMAAVELGERPLDHGDEQRRLVGEVAVDRRGGDADLGGQARTDSSSTSPSSSSMRLAVASSSSRSRAPSPRRFLVRVADVTTYLLVGP